jgi:hypothetical protein
LTPTLHPGRSERAAPEASGTRVLVAPERMLAVRTIATLQAEFPQELVRAMKRTPQALAKVQQLRALPTLELVGA